MVRHLDDYQDYYFGEPYMRYGPFEITTFLMGCFIAVVFVFSLACAIGNLAELAEEFPTRTKKILHALTISVLLIHIFILVVDRLSWWRSLLSIMTNVLYLRILAHFPRITFHQPFTIAAILGLLVELLSWYTFFVFSPRVSKSVGVVKLISFVTFILLVPTGLLVSLEVEPVTLPGSSMNRMTSSPHYVGISSGQQKVTVLRAVSNWFAALRG